MSTEQQTIHPLQIAKAVGALRAHLNGTLKTAKRDQLIDDGEYYELNINLRTILPKRRCSAQLKHSIYDRPELSICVFTTDPIAPFEKFLADEPIGQVTKIIGAKELATSFKQFAHRRILRQQFDHFFTHDAIVPQLPQLLGSKFIDTPKEPVKVHGGSKPANFFNNLRKALTKTHYHIPSGVSFVVRVGHSTQTDEQVVENIVSALPDIVKALPREWASIGSIYLKTSKSLSLPLYASLPQVSDYQSVDEAEQEATTPAPKKSKQSAASADAQEFVQLPVADAVVPTKAHAVTEQQEEQAAAPAKRGKKAAAAAAVVEAAPVVAKKAEAPVVAKKAEAPVVAKKAAKKAEVVEAEPVVAKKAAKKAEVVAEVVAEAPVVAKKAAKKAEVVAEAPVAKKAAKKAEVVEAAPVVAKKAAKKAEAEPVVAKKAEPVVAKKAANKEQAPTTKVAAKRATKKAVSA